jgi:macrolide-specific efflux system membrane fusion protein
MTVAFSESDITKVKVGQRATVTIDALSDVELGAHVTSISTVGTTSGGVVSYDATLTLDQTDSRVRPGMSASAAVIVAQAQGVTVPNQAVTGAGSTGFVKVLQPNGKTVQQQVVVGLRGDSRTQIVSGVKAGQQLVVTITLPSLSSSSSSSSGSSGTLGGAGLGGLGGGGGFFQRALGGGGGFRILGGGAAGGGGATP